MAFNFSQSNGFNPVDFVKHIELSEDTELATNDCNLILIVFPTNTGFTITADFAVGQTMIIVNGGTVPFTIADKRDPEHWNLELDDSEVALFVYKDNDGGFYKIALE